MTKRMAMQLDSATFNHMKNFLDNMQKKYPVPERTREILEGKPVTLEYSDGTKETLQVKKPLDKRKRK